MSKEVLLTLNGVKNYFPVKDGALHSFCQCQTEAYGVHSLYGNESIPLICRAHQAPSAHRQ